MVQVLSNWRQFGQLQTLALVCICLPNKFRMGLRGKKPLPFRNGRVGWERSQNDNRLHSWPIISMCTSLLATTPPSILKWGHAIPNVSWLWNWAHVRPPVQQKPITEPGIWNKERVYSRGSQRRRWEGKPQIFLWEGGESGIFKGKWKRVWVKGTGAMWLKIRQRKLPSRGGFLSFCCALRGQWSWMVLASFLMKPRVSAKLN